MDDHVFDRTGPRPTAPAVFHGHIAPSWPQYRRLVLPALGWKLWFLRGAGALAVAVGAVTTVTEGRWSALTIAYVMAGALLAVNYDLGAWQMWRRMGKGGPLHLRYAVSAAGIEVVSNTATVFVAAHDVTAVQRLPTGWLARTAVTPVPLFRDAFSAADAAGVDQLFLGG